MRLFLSAYVFDMVVRSMITLTPFDAAWLKDLKMERYPLALPMPSELTTIEQGKSERYEGVAERYGASLLSTLEYTSPWPSKKTWGAIESPLDLGKYVVVWVGTRLSFTGALLGLDQNWPMFSPNVRKSRVVPRAKLIFEDGSSKQLWLLGEPWDTTSFSRWFIKRPLQIDIRLHKDYDARLGVSRHLARTFPYSEAGSALRFVEMYKVTYHLPRPDQDAHRVLEKQNRKKTWKKPFWRYDVVTRKGKTIEDEDKDKKAKAKAKEAKARKDKPAKVTNDAHEKAQVDGNPQANKASAAREAGP
jgi:hypothetical protein